MSPVDVTEFDGYKDIAIAETILSHMIEKLSSESDILLGKRYIFNIK